MKINEPAAERIAGSIVTMAARMDEQANAATLAAGCLLAAINLKLAHASAAETARWLDDVGAEMITLAMTGAI